MSVSHRQNKRLALILALSTLAMFFFGYALVPLFNVLCSKLGINGKPVMLSVENHSRIDRTRTVTVEFLANTNANLPWIFKPVVQKLQIHPGQNAKIAYYFKNLTNRAITIQAIPSITPGLAAKHLKKTECFCFTHQTLSAQQEMTLPIIFHVDTELPQNVHTISLMYTLFEIRVNR